MGIKVPPPPPEWMVYKERMTRIIHEVCKGGVHLEDNPEEAAERVARLAERLITEIDAATERNTKRY